MNCESYDHINETYLVYSDVNGIEYVVRSSVRIHTIPQRRDTCVCILQKKGKILIAPSCMKSTGFSIISNWTDMVSSPSRSLFALSHVLSTLFAFTYAQHTFNEAASILLVVDGRYTPTNFYYSILYSCIIGTLQPNDFLQSLLTCVLFVLSVSATTMRVCNHIRTMYNITSDSIRGMYVKIASEILRRHTFVHIEFRIVV